MVEGPEELRPSGAGAPLRRGGSVRHVTDAGQFLGMEPVEDDLHWRLDGRARADHPGQIPLRRVRPRLPRWSPSRQASGRPTVWSTAQYLSLRTDRLGARPVGHPGRRGQRVTQGRAVGHVGDTEILTVNAALGHRTSSTPGASGSPARGAPPESARPAGCPTSTQRRSSTRSRSGWPEGVPSRRSSAGAVDSGDADQRPVGPGTRPPRALGGHPGHHRGLRPGGGVPAPRPAGHVPQPRQHPAGGPARADRVGALRHPDPGRWRSATARGRPTSGREGGALLATRASR